MLKNRIYTYIIGILILSSTQTFAQQKTFDSLFNKLYSFNSIDSNYINTLSIIGIHYQHRGMDSLLIIGERIIDLSTQINYTRGIGNGHKIKGIAYINLQEKNLALYHDSIAIDYYEKINDFKGIGAVYNNMAVLFNNYGEFHSANIYYNKSIKYRQQANDLKGMGDCYNNLGNNLSAVGDYNGALKSMLKGLSIRKSINDWDGLANSYSNLGNLYYYMSNFKKSEDAYWESFRIRKRIKSEYELANLYINIGGLCFERNNYDSAYYYFNEAFKMGKANQDNDVVIIALNNISEMFMEEHKYPAALKVIIEAEKYLEQDVDNENKIVLNSRKALYYAAIKDYQNAYIYGKIAYNTSLKIGSKRMIVETGEILADILEKDGKFDEALNYFKLSKQYADSIYNEENITKFNDFEYRYKLQDKEQEILKLEASKKIEEEKNKLLQIGFALLLAIIGGISLLTYSINSNRRKEKKINELTFKQNEILEQHHKFKDKIFSIIAHDLRSPVASLQNMFQLLDSNIITPEEFMSVKNDLSSQVNSLNLLLDNILIWAKKQMKSGLQTNKTKVSLNKLITQNKQLFNLIATKKGVNIETNISDEIDIIADNDQIDLIIRNLLSNAIKFTNKNGLVNISAYQTDDTIVLKIKDNGVGMDNFTIEKIYADSVISQKGTNGEQGTGLGLHLTKEFIANNNATCSLESTPNIGTEITITFNKA